MIKNQNVVGSYEASQPLIIDNDLVLIHTNIKQVKTYSIDNPEDYSIMYTYNELVLTKDEYLELLQEQISDNESNISVLTDTILELSFLDDKKESSKNVISLYANGSRTAYIPDATTVGAMWTNSIALGKKTIDDVPEQYKDEVTYRLENNIFD